MNEDGFLEAGNALMVAPINVLERILTMAKMYSTTSSFRRAKADMVFADVSRDASTLLLYLYYPYL